MRTSSPTCTVVILAIVATIGLASCESGLHGQAYLSDPACGPLFPTGTPQDDSMPPDPHVPVEALSSEPTPYLWATPVPASIVAPDCIEGLPLLAVEPVEEGPGGYVSFLLSPYDSQLVYDTTDGMRLLDLQTGRARLLPNSEGSPVAWLSESLLLISSWAARYDLHVGHTVDVLCLYDLHSARRTPLDVRWEHTGLDAGKFVGAFYTGWQAAGLLKVSENAVCEAVRDARLHTLSSNDGSLLLPRDELLAEGIDIVDSWYSVFLLSPTEIGDLCGKAEAVYALARATSGSPYTGSYWSGWSAAGANLPSDWSHSLVLTGLPGTPHNIAVQVDSEELWAAYPPIPSQTRMFPLSAEPHALDNNPDYFLRRDACFDVHASGYGYVLYRRGTDGLPATPLGVVPFPYSSAASMVWSPDGNSIYIAQSAFGRQSISRLRLDDLP